MSNWNRDPTDAWNKARRVLFWIGVLLLVALAFAMSGCATTEQIEQNRMRAAAKWKTDSGESAPVELFDRCTKASLEYDGTTATMDIASVVFFPISLILVPAAIDRQQAKTRQCMNARGYFDD